MYTIKAKQLTAEAFRKYGTYQNLLGCFLWTAM